MHSHSSMREEIFGHQCLNMSTTNTVITIFFLIVGLLLLIPGLYRFAQWLFKIFKKYCCRKEKNEELKKEPEIATINYGAINGSTDQLIQ